LSSHFMEECNTSERPLDDSDMIALKKKFAGGKDMIDLAQFAKLWVWFGAFEGIIGKIRPVWCTLQPRLINGLMSRDESTAKLRGKDVGTFIVRFSENNAGAIALAFVEEDGSVQHTLINTRAQGFTIVLTDGNRTYENLPELIMKCKKLTILYPDVDKATAFDTEDGPH